VDKTLTNRRNTSIIMKNNLINKDVDNMERSSNSKKLNIDVKAVEYILLLFFMPVYYFFS
jgi:hypothetical protein